MLADTLTREVFDGQRRACHHFHEPDWPAIKAAFRALDGWNCSWMTVTSGGRQLCIGGGQRGYVVVAQSGQEVLQARSPGQFEGELWLGGSQRVCSREHLHTAEAALSALKAFVLAGQLSPGIHWQAA